MGKRLLAKKTGLCLGVILALFCCRNSASFVSAKDTDSSNAAVVEKSEDDISKTMTESEKKNPVVKDIQDEKREVGRIRRTASGGSDGYFTEGDNDAILTSAVMASSYTGSCGESVSYSYDDTTQTLTITGTGKMADYSYDSTKGRTTAPYAEYLGRVKKIVFGEGVTYIGELSFMFSYALEEVSFSSTITTIGKDAFVGAVSLKTIYVPDTVKGIGSHSLGYVLDNGNAGKYVSNSMTIIAKDGLAGATYAKEEKMNYVSALTSSGSCGENATWNLDLVTGKLTINGSGAIDDYSFYGYNEPFNSYASLIKEVEISDEITMIGENCFSGLSALESIDLPHELTQLSLNAFYSCDSLKTVNMNQKLEKINNTFSYCSSLRELNIPASVTYINPSIGYACQRLREINVADSNENYKSLDGILYDHGLKNIIKVPDGIMNKTIIFPDTVSAHGYFAFQSMNNKRNRFVFTSYPGQLNYNDDFGNCICYYNSNDNAYWYTAVTSLKKGNGIWIDIADYADNTVLSLSTDKNAIDIGSMAHITTEISPVLADRFIWSSSNENILVVNSEGGVTGIAPGTATVTARSKDEKYSASINIKVNNASYSAGKHSIKTLSDFGKNSSVGGNSRFYACEKLNGFFIYNNQALGFYSFSTGKYSEVEEISALESFFANDKLYIADEGSVTVIDLIKREVVSSFSKNMSVSGIGADSQGRIYLAGIRNSSQSIMALYSPDGELLDEIVTGVSVYRFSGFDDKNGYFYMESSYNYYSWGYDHYGVAATMGKVSDNKLYQIDVVTSFLESGMISRSIAGLEYLYQNYYGSRQLSSELLDNRYFVTTSYTMGRVCIFDSYSATDESINSLMTVARSGTDGNLSGVDAIGVEAAINPNNNSIILYENNNQINEYSLDSRDKISSVKTAHRVYYMFRCGNNLVIVEKDGGSFYLETIDYSAPTSIAIKANTSMKAGTYQQLALSTSQYYSITPQWSSANAKVLTVNNDGVASAWKPGAATVTAKVGNLKATANITVTAGDVVTPSTNIKKIGSAYSSNVSQNNYSIYGKTVKSYMYENPDKSISTVEWVSSQSKLYIRNFDKSYNEVNDVIVNAPLDIFGGFYSGKSYNYAVFGQKNESESDSTEIIRVVRYSKDYKSKKELSIKGENTYIPFDAGSLRMAETSGGKLYIHTCHEMYESGDGYHHQANMTFVIDENNMTVLDKYSDVMNIAQAGYVSHSFNQFVQTDDKKVYRVDHGDANPRGITLTVANVSGSITDVRYVVPLGIYADGYNDTGASAGGLELSLGNALIAGNSVDQENAKTDDSRNIFMTISSKDLTKYDIKWFTSFAANSKTTARTPQLVKINDEQFLLLWEEYDSSKKTTVTKIASVGSQGDVSEMVSTSLRLSDCKPIVTSDGLVKWFVTDYKNTQIISVNPFELSKITGAVSIDSAAEAYARSGSEYNKDVVLPGDTSVKPGTKIEDKGKEIYTVTGEKTLEYKGDPKAKGKVTVPATLKYNGVTWKVTSIADNAFKGNKKITSVTIGSNVTKIGKNAFSGCTKLKKVIIGKNVTTIGSKAFYNCKKLKTIIFKGTKLKKVGKNAIKGIHKKAVIKAPKKKVKAYKKLFKKNTGYKKFMKIKKS